jgi:hypothetical protein
VRAWARGCPLLTGAPGQQAVLAMLALRAGQEVTEAELVDGLYGEGVHAEDAAGWAAEEVRRTTVRLGRLLGSPTAPQLPPHTAPRGHGLPVLHRTGDGYLLDLAADRVDALAFERLVGAAHAIRSCSPTDSADLVRRAFALWHGTPLDGLPGPFAEGERIRLHAVHAVAAGLLPRNGPSPRRHLPG